VEAIRYVDLVIPEDNWDQKRSVRELKTNQSISKDVAKKTKEFIRQVGL